MSQRGHSDTDYYALLGVGHEAGEDEIRQAFRALARRLHPDVNDAPDAAARFTAVLRAYETLSDAERRRVYDDLARARHRVRRSTPFAAGQPFDPGGVAGGAAAAGPSGSEGTPYGMPAGHSRFDAPFTRDRPVYYNGATGVLPRSALRGLDVHHTVHLSLAEAASGTVKDVRTPRREVCILCGGAGAGPGGVSRACPTCHGSGRARSGAEACFTCGGSGSVVDVICTGCGGSGRRDGLFDLEGVRFPPGLPSYGYVRRFKGEGDPGPRGGPRGELLLHVVVDDDPQLHRASPESPDILSEITISAAQAARGGTIEAPTLYGPATLRLPRGVTSGTVYTLRGKGLRIPGRFGRGKQYVTLRVEPAEPQPRE